MNRLEIAVKLLVAHVGRGSGEYATNKGLETGAWTGAMSSTYDGVEHENRMKFLAQSAIKMADFLLVEERKAQQAE